MAVDADRPARQRALVHLRLVLVGALRGAVAVAALLGAIALHARPLVLGHLLAVRLVLFRGIDDSGEVAPDLLRRLDLAHHLGHELARQVTV